jgi:hypothetical protein
VGKDAVKEEEEEEDFFLLDWTIFFTVLLSQS